MANLYQGLARGPIDHQSSSVINMIADGEIEMGSTIKLKTSIDTSELLPRALQIVEDGDVSYGIAVGGDTDGIYPTDGISTGTDESLATNAAGEGVVVVTQGRCLARVDGTILITPGDKLVASDTKPGVLVVATSTDEFIIATALQLSAVTTDTTTIIAVDVQREGLNT